MTKSQQKTKFSKKEEKIQTDIYNTFLIDISNAKKRLHDKFDDRVESLWKNDAITASTKDAMKDAVNERLEYA